MDNESERVSALEAKVENLEGWQKNQNGALLRMADQVDALKSWLIGLLGTGLLSIILLVANLLIKLNGGG